ncbi:MAG: riboflavin synthase subunit alpha [Alphaproteobacteria bacterium]|nr:MAG: riboflavin synthase subunit alpha [Alphaproteobacteria bacterium]
MFTGIITDIGELISLDKQGDWQLRIKTHWNTRDIDIGASIACSGICLTVLDRKGDYFDVSASMETVSITTLQTWQLGKKINLERALRVGDELGGHIVSGHVDGIITLSEIKPDNDSYRLKFLIDDKFKGLIASKGSVCIDGISLTVNSVTDSSFDVNIISHTWNETTFGNCVVGDAANLEIDMLARYVARLLETKK